MQVIYNLQIDRLIRTTNYPSLLRSLGTEAPTAGLKIKSYILLGIKLVDNKLDSIYL